MTSPSPDRSVRLAWHADAPAIAEIQAAAWRTAYRELLPSEVLDQLPIEQFIAAWEQSIGAPKQARQRVLVALERASVRGFTTTAPSTDGDADPSRDGEIGELVVDLHHLGAGHGSRLLHAAVDTLRSDGFSHATFWLASTNDDLRLFLTNQGWAADGAFRELDLYGDGTVTVKQIRLHTDLTVA